VITESPALQAREAQVIARYTDSLAALIAEESQAGEDAVEPWGAANAIMGVHRGLLEFVRHRTLAGAPAKETARAFRAERSEPSAGWNGGSATTP